MSPGTKTPADALTDAWNALRTGRGSRCHELKGKVPVGMGFGLSQFCLFKFL